MFIFWKSLKSHTLFSWRYLLLNPEAPYSELQDNPLHWFIWYGWHSDPWNSRDAFKMRSKLYRSWFPGTSVVRTQMSFTLLHPNIFSHLHSLIFTCVCERGVDTAELCMDVSTKLDSTLSSGCWDFQSGLVDLPDNRRQFSLPGS